MAHALGDDRAAATKGGVSPPKMTTKSLPGSLRDRYTNADTRNTTTTDKDDDNKSSIHRSNNVPSSRIVGFGTSPAVPVLARGGGKSFTERARSKLEQLKHKTQEALQARKERQQREQQQQQQGTTTSGSLQSESTRELTRAMRRETVSEVVASATSAAELLFELRTCVLTDSREGGEPDASTHDMIAEMTHVCEERRARLAGLAGDEGLSEGNLVLVLETIEKVNGALDSGIDGPPSTTTTTTTTTFIAASGEDENGVPAPPANPIGVSAGNPFATPALSSPTTPSTRTVTRMDVPQTPEEEEAALAAAIAASLQIEDENKRKTTESQSLSLPAPPPPQQQQQQQQQVSDSNDIGNLIDF